MEERVEGSVGMIHLKRGGPQSMHQWWTRGATGRPTGANAHQDPSYSLPPQKREVDGRSRGGEVHQRFLYFHYNGRYQ